MTERPTLEAGFADTRIEWGAERCYALRAVEAIGGLMVEMYRRDQFRQDLIVDRCAELSRIDERLAELDTLLTVAASRGRVREAARCECGATLFWGAKFCNQCGAAL